MKKIEIKSCYIFNSGPDNIKSVNQPGKINGLSMILYGKLPKVLKRIVPNYGFTIKLDNSSFEVSGPDGIDLLSGVETSIAVHRIVSKQLPEPFSNW